MASVFVTIVGFFCFLSVCQAAEFSELVVFGDSLSDTGNRPAPSHYFEDRFSNGPIWVDFLASELGLPSPSPVASGGKNFAVAGATTGSNQLNTSQNMNRQVNDYLNANTPTGEELFVLWGGTNDFNAGQTDGTAPVLEIIQQMEQLADAGADSFLVPNVSVRLGFGETRAREVFNDKLRTELSNVRAENPTLTIYELDFSDLLNKVDESPASFGFGENRRGRLITSPACKNCGFGEGIAEAAIIVDDPSIHFFWDGIHPSTAGHRVIANAALIAVPEPAGLRLAAAGLLSTLLLWRRALARKKDGYDG